MKRERVVEAKPDVQESDVVLEEESIPVVAEAEAPRATTGIKGGRPSHEKRLSFEFCDLDPRMLKYSRIRGI